MARYTISGLIPFRIPRRDTGGYMTPGTIPGWSGKAAACLNHWNDNVIVLTYPALWFVTAGGLKVIHTLDDVADFERAILERVRRGEMGFSYGPAPSPETNQTAGEWIGAWYKARPAILEYEVHHIRTIHHIGHMSYGDIQEVAYEQRPAVVEME